MVVEENNYLGKIVNVYIVYDLDAWPRIPTNNFKFKNCLFGATSIVKNSDKEEYVKSGCGITFDSAGSWSFNNDSYWNVIVFGVGSSSSSQADNCKNNLLMLGEGPTCVINGSFDNKLAAFSQQRKKIILVLVNPTQNFAWFRIMMLIIVICLLMEKKSLNLKPTIKVLSFQLIFVSEVYLMDLAPLSPENYL